jgi:dihydrolipoamide dehydrogenase
MLANQATAEAWIAGRHAAGAEVFPFRPETVIHAIYSEPQVAQIGVVEGNSLNRVTVDYAEALKSHLVPDSAGFIELVFNQEREITGALAVGLHAADVLAPVAVAIQMGAKLDEVAPIFAAHPTLSELVFIAARSA